MKSPLLLAATLTVLLATATACGTTDPTVDGAAPPTTRAVVTPETQPIDPPDTSTPPPTPSPTTPAPPTPTPTPTIPASPRPVESDRLTIDDGSFASVAEMGENSALVIVGEVVEVTSLGVPFAGDDDANEFVAITVKPVDTLAGEPTDEIVMSWQAFATDLDGNRAALLLTNGLRTPEVGDRLVLFLNPADPAFDEFLGGVLTHQLVKLDGIAYLDGDRVIAGEVGSPAAELLLAMTLSEIRDAVGS